MLCLDFVTVRLRGDSHGLISPPSTASMAEVLVMTKDCASSSVRLLQFQITGKYNSCHREPSVPATCLFLPPVYLQWWMACCSVLQAPGPELIFGGYTPPLCILMQIHHTEMVKTLRSAAPCLVPPGSRLATLPTDL